MKIVTDILVIGAGSCLGGIARYLVSRALQAVCHTLFPWGTFAVNVAGCFIIGLVFGLLDRGVTMSDSLRLFVTVGFCGGFTTFSTFMNENYLLFTGPGHLTMLLYAAGSLVAGFLALYLAYYLTSL